MISKEAVKAAVYGDNALHLRSVDQVMDLERLGSMHQSRLSFMRSLVRRVMLERWQINIAHIMLCEQGYGTVIYEIKTNLDFFSLVIFSNYLADEDRNDRVVAEKWDLTMALVSGKVESEYLEFLRANVPLQEAGRVDERVLVLSRANRSARNFNYVVDQLSEGLQPAVEKIAKVGYLYRTTAVYGSGKLGMADWDKIKQFFPDFARPFAAEMFVCFMIRSFSLFQVEHIAKHRSPKTFNPLRLDIKRYFGIGNSTGLGMAPYLINHPLLISQWVEVRELALSMVCTLGEINEEIQQKFMKLLKRSQQHISQTFTENEWQTQNNIDVANDLKSILTYIEESSITSWHDFMGWCAQNCVIQTQELMVSILLELYPALVNDLDMYCDVDEEMALNPIMMLEELKSVIEKHYQWALDINFDDLEETKTFWYRSENKMEPRLGTKGVDDGDDKQMLLGVAYEVMKCYQILIQYMVANPNHTTARFLVDHPQLRGIIRRIQTMSLRKYGDIQVNLLSADVLPMHLLRAKLAFFGVSKFDPRSKLWVRNTMYQGAPLLGHVLNSF